jgi:prephenate dehydratase
VPTILDIFAAVQASTAAYGVVPFENSSNGSVVFTLDLFADRDAQYQDILVDAEAYVSVVHCLLGRKAPSKANEGKSEVKEEEGVKEVKEEAAEEEKPSEKTQDLNESPQPPESATPADPHTLPNTAELPTEPPALPSTTVLPVEPSALPNTTEPTSDSGLPDLSHLTKLYSHPQAWGQCTRFLSSSPQLKATERQDVSSTSRAAQLVAEDETSAAISSKLAAEEYGLDILREGIEDRKNNTTRFLVLRRGNPGEGDVKGIDEEDELVEEMVKVVEGKGIGEEEDTGQKTQGEWIEREEEYEKDRNEKERDDSAYDYYRTPTSEPQTTTLASPSVEPPKAAAPTPAVLPSPKHAAHKTLITFTICHSNPGALAASLSVFSKHGLNLTSINTRPSGVQNWNYIFFVELQGRREEDGGGEVNAALKELWDVCKGLRWLGSWENALAKQS